ncbi:MAG: hypothetical protein AAB263_05910, partial [Planctomycetota bacterium]
ALGLIHVLHGRDWPEVAQHEWRNPCLYIVVVPLAVTLFVRPVLSPSVLIASASILAAWFLLLAVLWPRATMEWTDLEHPASATARLIGHFERGPNLALIALCTWLWSAASLPLVRPWMAAGWTGLAAACLVLSASAAGYIAAAGSALALMLMPTLRHALWVIRWQLVAGLAIATLLVGVVVWRVPITGVDRLFNRTTALAIAAIDTHAHGPGTTDWTNARAIMEQAEKISSTGASSVSSRDFQHRLVWANLTGAGWFSGSEMLVGDLHTTNYRRFDSQYLNVAYNAGLLGLCCLFATIAFAAWWWILAWRRRPAARSELAFLAVAALLILGPFWLTAAFQQRYPINLLTCLIAARIWFLSYAVTAEDLPPSHPLPRESSA